MNASGKERRSASVEGSRAQPSSIQPSSRIMAHGAVLGDASVTTSFINGDFCPFRRRSNPLIRLFTPASSHHAGKKHCSLAPAIRASLSEKKEFVLRSFRDRRALKIISGLQNFDKENVASVVIAAEKGGATHVDIACDPELVKLAMSLTTLPVCVSSVEPMTFLAAVEAGALMIEIGNYDSFYDLGRQFSSEQILSLTRETKRILPFITLSVTVPHILTIPDQVLLAELLEQEGVDIIQTEGGKYSTPSEPGVIGLIEKATPTIAAAYSISRAVKIPVLCSSGLSAVTAPLALAAGAAGVGVGSAVNRLNDVVAMIAEVKSLAESLGLREASVHEDFTTAVL